MNLLIIIRKLKGQWLLRCSALLDGIARWMNTWRRVRGSNPSVSPLLDSKASAVTERSTLSAKKMRGCGDTQPQRCRERTPNDPGISAKETFALDWRSPFGEPETKRIYANAFGIAILQNVCGVAMPSNDEN